MASMHARLPAEEAAPLTRALLRVAAELPSAGRGDELARSRAPEIRSADAFVEHARAHQVMLRSVSRRPLGGGVRTTVSLDDHLLAEAQRLTGMTEKAALLRMALTALIERESARRLARLGGSEPDMQPVARRRSATG